MLKSKNIISLKAENSYFWALETFPPSYCQLLNWASVTNSGYGTDILQAKQQLCKYLYSVHLQDKQDFVVVVFQLDRKHIEIERWPVDPLLLLCHRPPQ